MAAERITSFYLNGLGDGNLRPREESILHGYSKHGIDVVTANINWRSPETFPELRDRIAEQAADILARTGDLGKLVLQGTSAGGGLAIQVSKQLNDPRVRVISHSGRLRTGEPSRWGAHDLERAAHLGTDEASQSFYDSVKHFEESTVHTLN
jgi:hypothetical protein